jgi:tetratricopeptide (TPR) repeat protein
LSYISILPFLCLIFLNLLFLVQIPTLSWGQIVRLFPIFLAMMYLGRSAILENEGSIIGKKENQVYLLVLIYVFCFLQLGGEPLNVGFFSFYVLVRLILLAALFAFLLSRFSGIGRFSLVDRWVIGSLAVFSIITLVARQQDSGALYVLRVADFLLIGIVYFLITRLPWQMHGHFSSPILFIRISIVVFGIVASAGAARIGTLVFYFNEGLTDLRKGEYSQARSKIERVHELNSQLHISRYSTSSFLVEVEKIPLSEFDLSTKEREALGALWGRFGAWDFAARLYETALKKNPHDSWLLGNLGEMYIELGAWSKALDLFEKGIAQFPDHAPIWYTGQIVVKAHQMDWSGSVEALRLALKDFPALSGKITIEGLKALREERGLGATDGLAPYLMKLNTFELIEICRALGWAVLAEPSWIGNTDFSIPFDVLIVSKKGDAQITVGSHDWELSRGYNFVTIDPINYEVSGPFCFDIYLGESWALVKFIHSLPRGTIILGAVENEATALTDQALSALGTVGLIKRPLGSYCVHAFIGRKGLQPGSALELISQDGLSVVGVHKGNIKPLPDEGDIKRALETVLRHKPEREIAVYVNPRGNIEAFRKK